MRGARKYLYSDPDYVPALDPDFVDALRRAMNGGWPLGRRVTPGKAGRPAKPRDDARQMRLS